MGKVCFRCQKPWAQDASWAQNDEDGEWQPAAVQDKAATPATPLQAEQREKLQQMVAELQELGVSAEHLEAKLRATEEKPTVTVAPSKAFNVAKNVAENAEKALDKAVRQQKWAEEALEEARKNTSQAKEKRDKAEADRKQAFDKMSADEQERIQKQHQQSEEEAGKAKAAKDAKENDDALLAEMAAHGQDENVVEAKRALAETIRVAQAAAKRRRTEKSPEEGQKEEDNADPMHQG